MTTTPTPPPAPRAPTALILSYVVGAGVGAGSIPLGAWVCNSTRDEMGLGFILFCGIGALAGCLAALALSVVSLVRRERARGLAITNVVVIGGALLATGITALVSYRS